MFGRITQISACSGTQDKHLEITEVILECLMSESWSGVLTRIMTLSLISRHSNIKYLIPFNRAN